MKERVKMIEQRKLKSLLQEDIAKELGVTQQAISQIEQGKRTPSLKLATEISRVYGLTIKELFPDIFLTRETTKCNIKDKEIN